jgi:hypothetical protein
MRAVGRLQEVHDHALSLEKINAKEKINATGMNCGTAPIGLPNKTA